MKFLDVTNTGVKQLSPYQAGKPIEELERELGIHNIIKLASNENPFGFSDVAKQAILNELNQLLIPTVFTLNKQRQKNLVLIRHKLH